LHNFNNLFNGLKMKTKFNYMQNVNIEVLWKPLVLNMQN